MDKANNTKKEDLDEEKLVEKLKPLIEQATGILQETHGAIKALDPDGKIARSAQHKTADSEATHEEQHLAQGLTEVWYLLYIYRTLRCKYIARGAGTDSSGGVAYG